MIKTEVGQLVMLLPLHGWGCIGKSLSSLQSFSVDNLRPSHSVLNYPRQYCLPGLVISLESIAKNACLKFCLSVLGMFPALPHISSSRCMDVLRQLYPDSRFPSQWLHPRGPGQVSSYHVRQNWKELPVCIMIKQSAS